MLSGPKPVTRRRLFLWASTALLACHPVSTPSAVEQVGDPAPPRATILATLTEVGALLGDARGGAEVESAPAVVGVSPNGSGSTYEPIALTFSTPMDAAASSLEFELEPLVPGKATWTSPTRVTFVPEHALSEASLYTVRVAGEANTRGGHPIVLDERWSFETPRPTASISGGRRSYDDEGPVPVPWTSGFQIGLSGPAGESAVRDALTVVRIQGRRIRPVPFRLQANLVEPGETATADWSVLPKGHWPADATIRATLGDGLTVVDGPLPTGQEVFATLRTRAGFTVEVDCEDSAVDGCVMGTFSLDFDTELPKSALSKIRVSPKPKDFDPHLFLDDEEETFSSVLFHGEFEAGRTYTVRFVESLRDVTGQVFSGKSSLSVSFVAPPPKLSLEGMGTQLAGRRGTFGIESRSVEAATLIISTLSNAALAELVNEKKELGSLPKQGVETRTVELDLSPSGSWGWDAREFSLAKELGGKTGAAFVELVPGAVRASQRGRAELGRSEGLVQFTNLGLLVADSPAGGFVRVLTLDTASPVAGATAHLYTAASPAKLVDSFGPSDSQGFIRIPAKNKLDTRTVVVETKGDRVALGLSYGQGPWRSNGGRSGGLEHGVGVVMTDRGLYQPGERMRVMGWVARSTTENPAGIEGSGTSPVIVRLYGRGDELLAESTVRTKAYGKFWATLDIPANAKLGQAQVKADVTSDLGGSFSRTVDLREFVAPAFDVSVSLKEADLLHGETARLSAMARYLHGMPIPVAEASLRTRCEPDSYRPVNSNKSSVASAVTSASVRTSGWLPVEKAKDHGKGRIEAEVAFPGLDKAHPYVCSVSLLTMDAARQELGSTASVRVHPSRYLLVGRDESSARVGVPRTIEVRAVLPSGEPSKAKPAKLIFEHRPDRETGTKEHTCNLLFDDAGIARCTWVPRKSGDYRSTFIGGVDGVEVRSVEDIWISDRLSPAATAKKIEFAVSVPKTSAVGESVDIEVQTTTPQATGVLVEVHAGIRATHPFRTQDHRAQLQLKADETWVPRGYLATLVAHPDAKRAMPYVESSFDSVRLGYESRALEVSVKNPKTASVGSTLPIDIAVSDPDGHAVPDAHVSVWAVDEGILMLRDWKFPALPQTLAIDRGNEASTFHSYGALRLPYLLRQDPFEPDLIGRGIPGGVVGGIVGGVLGGSAHGVSGAGGGKVPAVTRRNFDAAPIFIGDVKTGDDGTARVYGVLPDNLTTFRIAAVATAEVAGTGAFARAGREESRVRVTQDLSVRPVLPRILRPGDRAELGILVDNLAGVPGSLEVEVKLTDARGIARITSASTITTRLDDPQVRIPVTVEAQRAGELLVWVSAKVTTDEGRVLQDASEFPLEVRVERTLVRHSATYGSLTEPGAGAVALKVPPAHIPDSALASVDVYASMLGGYKGAADSLITYPYGCIEQTSSRLVPLAALQELEGFDLGAGDVRAAVAKGLERIAQMQTPSGGFGYWPGASHAHVYGTAYATWVLTELQRSGVRVDNEILDRAVTFLNRDLERVRSYGTPTTHEDTRATMAVLATASVGQPNTEVVDELVARLDSLPAFARALLTMAVHAADPKDMRLPALQQSLRDRVELRDTTARSRAESRRFTEFFDSPIRTDAMILLALIRTAPEDPLIEPLARGMSEARDRGQLRNTQENAYALLAMAGYASLRESVEPDMDVRAWLGADMILDAQFKGRDLSVLHKTGALDAQSPLVTLQRLGKGRLYYRVGMQWAPEPSTIEAQARGIAIERTLHDVRGPLDDRSLVAGEAGALEVVITAEVRQRYVAIDVPLPAGIEAVDRSLGRGGASTTVLPSTGGQGLPYSHHELRGDRIVVFVDQLPAGTYHYRVPVRATHEGHYSMPPATVHAMYSPEVAANTAGRKVRVVSP